MRQRDTPVRRKVAATQEAAQQRSEQLAQRPFRLKAKQKLTSRLVLHAWVSFLGFFVIAIGAYWLEELPLAFGSLLFFAASGEVLLKVRPLLSNLKTRYDHGTIHC